MSTSHAYPACPSCGFIDVDDSTYCPNCRTRLKTQCRRCWVVNRIASHYCRGCGVDLTEKVTFQIPDALAEEWRGRLSSYFATQLPPNVRIGPYTQNAFASINPPYDLFKEPPILRLSGKHESDLEGFDIGDRKYRYAHGDKYSDMVYVTASRIVITDETPMKGPRPHIDAFSFSYEDLESVRLEGNRPGERAVYTFHFVQEPSVTLVMLPHLNEIKPGLGPWEQSFTALGAMFSPSLSLETAEIRRQGESMKRAQELERNITFLELLYKFFNDILAAKRALA